MDILPLIPDKSVQLILADLPYGTTANKWDSVLDLNKLWAEYERIITIQWSDYFNSYATFHNSINFIKLKVIQV